MNNDTEILATFRRGPEILEQALESVTAEEMGYAPVPGKWNIRQLARHLADTEIVAGMRLRQIIAEDRPTLAAFNQDAWANSLGYENSDPFDSLARFRSLREDTSRVLESLPPEAFDRVGLHGERGERSLREWVTIFGRHVESHARQIQGIREAWRQR